MSSLLRVAALDVLVVTRGVDHSYQAELGVCEVRQEEEEEEVTERP